MRGLWLSTWLPIAFSQRALPVPATESQREGLVWNPGLGVVLKPSKRL